MEIKRLPRGILFKVILLSIELGITGCRVALLELEG